MMNPKVVSKVWRTLGHREIVVVIFAILMGLSLVATFWVGMNVTRSTPQAFAATPHSLLCNPWPTQTADTCINKPADFGIALPWEAGRAVYRGSYTYGCCVVNGKVTQDHLGKDAYALDFAIGPGGFLGTPGGSGGRPGHASDVDAIASGKVVWEGLATGGFCGYGNSVAIQHDYNNDPANNYTSFYTHLASIDPSVTYGATIAQGQTIGQEGNTSCNSIPVHLHFVLYASPKSVLTITNYGANPPDGNTDPNKGAVTIMAVVPEPFIGGDRQGNPVAYENLEWFGHQTPLISYHPPAISPNPAPNPGGVWNSGTTPDLGQVTYDSPVHFDVQATDTQPIAEVHLTINYQNSNWSVVSPGSIFSSPAAFPQSSNPNNNPIWRIIADCNGITQTCVTSTGTATWTGTSTNGRIQYDWYPDREAMSGISSPVPWLPPANPALTYLSGSTASVCISFDVIDIYGVGNLAPSGTHCGNTSTVNHPASSVLFPRLTDNADHQVTLDAPATPQACPPNGTANPSMSNLTLTNNQNYAIQYNFMPNDLSNIERPERHRESSQRGRHAWRLDIKHAHMGKHRHSSLAQWRINAQLGANLTIAPGMSLSYVGGSITLASGASLTLQGGNQIGFAPGNNDLWASSSSTLSLSGTSSAPIAITSAAATPAPGDWQGVILTSGSTDTLNFVAITDAGRSVTYNSASYSTGLLVASANASLSYPTVSASSGNDIELVGGTQPSLEFGSYGMVPAGHYGVANDGWTSAQPLVDARYSWWGDASGPAAPDNLGGAGAPVTPGVNYLPWGGIGGRSVLRLSVGGGSAGAQVTLTGAGFESTPQRETVNLYVGTQFVGTTQVLFDRMTAGELLGQIQATITIPALAPGVYIVKAVGQLSGRSAQASFTITAHAAHSSPAPSVTAHNSRDRKSARGGSTSAVWKARGEQSLV